MLYCAQITVTYGRLHLLRYMQRSNRSTLQENAPVFLLLVISCLLTLLAFFAQQRMQRDTIATHATSDAKEFVGALRNGVTGYLHLKHDFGGFSAASNEVRLEDFDAYLKTIQAIEEHPGLSYLGFVPRVRRAEKDRFEARMQREHKGFADRGSGQDPDHIYPYLYAYPLDERSAAARGIDFAGIPERWSAMQKARDSGETIATGRHDYVAGLRTAPIIVVFTPVYDLAMPVATVEQRRSALRGFVFSIYHVRAMIESVFGKNFHSQFDLEIFDGPASSNNILYDGDERPHALLKERKFEIHHREQVTIGGRAWQLYFFPKQQYFARYESSLGMVILVGGLGSSAALAWALAVWLRRNRSRLSGEKQTLRFDEVFESHPSAVYLLDPQRRFVNANSRAVSEFMLSKEELIGKSIEQLIVPEKQALARGRFEEVLKGNSVTYNSAIFDGQGNRAGVGVFRYRPLQDGQRYVWARCRRRPAGGVRGADYGGGARDGPGCEAGRRRICAVAGRNFGSFGCGKRSEQAGQGDAAAVHCRRTGADGQHQYRCGVLRARHECRQCDPAGRWRDV